MPDPTDVKQEELINPQGEEQVTPPVTEPQEPEETEAGTPQEPVTPEEPEQKVPYERFKQVNDERKQLLELLQRQQQVPQTPQQAPSVDPNEGLTPEEQVFYNNLDKRTQNIVERVAKKKEEQFNQALGQIQLMVGKVLTKQFRKDHSDIKPNSPEEFAISQKVAQGFDAEDAYKVVMFDKHQQETQNKAKQTQQQRIQAKKKANVEGASTPPNSGLPQKKEGWREQASRFYEEELKKGWQG